MKCESCKYWEQTTFYVYDKVVNQGQCKQIRDKIEIELHTGWDGGYVMYVETDSDFGCNLYESI